MFYVLYFKTELFMWELVTNSVFMSSKPYKGVRFAYTVNSFCRAELNKIRIVKLLKIPPYLTFLLMASIDDKCTYILILKIGYKAYM